MLVFLIGFMGSGKTTVAKRLSSVLKMDWFDLDQWIEAEEEETIPGIFQGRGEATFRQLEYHYLRQLGSKKHQVISTGGGTPCFHDNMDFMNSAGLTVYLRLTPGQLYSRLKDSRNNRPLLPEQGNEALLYYIRSKLAEREPYYEKAQIHVNGFDLNINDLKSKILAHRRQ
jgi:shikimate kinase